jgi:CBS domain-containing membrane protein
MTTTLLETNYHDTTPSDFKSMRRRKRVYHLMTRNVLCLKYSDHLNLLDATPDWRKFRHLPVIDDDGVLKGMICHRDLMNDFASSLASPPDERLHSDLQNVAVKEVMIWNVLTTNESETLEEAAKKMFENRCGALPVVDWDNKLVGIITEADFAKVFYLGEECLTQTPPSPPLAKAI